uniref:asparaginase n=1 Tax=Herpetomonas muscarum TaxID=5718 RepID=U5KLH8_HERMU|nr:asparaginase [Herpetomonas muscarum]
MLRLFDETDPTFLVPSNILAPERNIGSPDRGRVLIINTRSYESDLLDADEHAEADPKHFFLRMLSENDDLHKDGVPPFDVAQMDDLKLSIDQSPEDWVKLARLIQQNYLRYDGFVVQSGSDNMVTTATALSFMLENLGKPVIFTGSLIPANRIYTDMKRNIILALFFAMCNQISEVCIQFDEKLFRANRTIKTSRCSLMPYDSPNFPPLAAMHSGAMAVYKPLLRPHPHGKLRVMPAMKEKVLLLQLGPSAAEPAIMRAAIRNSKARGLVLLCYGSGNGPTRGDFTQDLIKEALDKDMVVVICTQNRYGSVDLAEYEAGRQLMEAGAVSAGDMTHEATMFKLKYLFGLGLTSRQVRKYLVRDLRGELTQRTARL